jgi:hypothetical protein
MPLHVLPPPAPALRSVLAALSSPSAGPGGRTRTLRTFEGPVSTGSALPVHVLDRLGPAPAPVTRLTGWRFPIHGGGRPVAAADTRLTADGWTFSHFLEGPYLASAEQVLRQAESLPGAYQPRLLSVPGLYMLALWLHGDTGSDAESGAPDPADLLVPLAPAPPGIASHRPVPVADLLPVMTLRLASAPLLGTPA